MIFCQVIGWDWVLKLFGWDVFESWSSLFQPPK
jgi:hypothetical protein